MEDLRQTGTEASCRNRLKISRKTPTSWSAHNFKTQPNILSGPRALLAPFSGWRSPVAAGQEAGAGLLAEQGVQFLCYQVCQSVQRHCLRCHGESGVMTDLLVTGLVVFYSVVCTCVWLAVVPS